MRPADYKIEKSHHHFANYAAFFATSNGESSDTGNSYAGTGGFRINW